MPGSFGCGSPVLASNTTFAPSRAARLAIASPMPRLPPDMMMVFPSREPVCADCVNPHLRVHRGHVHATHVHQEAHVGCGTGTTREPKWSH
ncbi:hypothetical protein ACFPRL_16155 [Pseudoclavibacter helvolus]